MKISKYLFLILLLSACFQFVIGQYEYPGEKPDSKKGKNGKNLSESRLFFGGNIGLSFWNQYAYVELSPLVGYKITPRFWAGGGPKYMYLKITTYNGHYYGIKTFAQYAVLNNINEVLSIGIGSILLYVEDEILSTDLYLDRAGGYYYQGDRIWHNIPFAGFGLRFPMGERAGITLFVLWGLSDYAEVLYNNPEIRLSIDF